MDLTLDTDSGKLNIRVAAWIESQNSLLVSKYVDGIISLPGGRVKFSETTSEAVKREVLEETGENFYDVELFSVIENFFLEKQSKKDFHEFLFVYKPRFPKNYNVVGGTTPKVLYNCDCFFVISPTRTALPGFSNASMTSNSSSNSCIV